MACMNKVLLALALTFVAILLTPHSYDHNTFMNAKGRSIGINEAGILANNGSNVSYFYGTKEILGIFNFYGGAFYSGPPVNKASFSVQLNSNVNITENDVLFVQNVFQIYYSNSSDLYYISVADNLWNLSLSSKNRVSSININYVKGYGNFASYNKTIFYYDQAKENLVPIIIKSKPPFTLEASMRITKAPNNFPEIYFYFYFKNSTYSTGELYDKVLVLINSKNPMFLIGKKPKSGKNASPFITQWVICGNSEGSELTVYSWNSSMLLKYLYNGKLYTVPGALSVPPLKYEGAVTAESVNNYFGIAESYNGSYVVQQRGKIQEEFLWQPRAFYNVSGPSLTITLVPGGARWNITVIGNAYKNSTTGNLSMIKYTLKPGNYSIYATLYAGPEEVFVERMSVAIRSCFIHITSPLPFYVNGMLYNNGSYSIKAPANVSFVNTYYINGSARLIYLYALMNGKAYSNKTLKAYCNASIIPIYQRQYLVSLGVPVRAYINNTEQNLSAGWYNSGTNITIPPQVVYLGSGERLIIYKEATYLVNAPLNISPPFYKQYYIKVNEKIPAYINGVEKNLTPGWYNESTRIFIPHYYYKNSTVRVLIKSSIYNIKVDRTMAVNASLIKQFYCIIVLPNGTIKNWYDQNDTIMLPKVIYIGNNTRYLLNQRPIVKVKPKTIVPKYIIQYLVKINGREKWYNNGTIIRIYKQTPIYEEVVWVGNYTIPNNSTVLIKGPIVENPKTSPNPYFFAIVVAIALLLALLLFMPSKKGVKGPT